MPVKYIKGARVKWPEWAEPDDPQVSALMNQAVNEANAMILTEMGSEPNMPTDPATGQGMPTRTLKRNKPGRYSINISGGKQYIDIYAQELAEEVAGVDPALQQRMVRKPVIVWYMYDTSYNLGGFYITIETGFNQRTWWYEYVQEDYAGKGLNFMFIAGQNIIDYKGIFGLPPGMQFVPEGLQQNQFFSIWNSMPLVANQAGGYGLFYGDYSYDSYDETTYSQPPAPYDWQHFYDTCMSGRIDGTSIATSQCGTCPAGSAHESLPVDCTGLTHYWSDGYSIIPCPNPGTGGSGPQHSMGNTLFCGATCHCGAGAVMYCCRSGRWEGYSDDCFMCMMCTISWSVWHEGSCACEDVCPGPTYWKRRERGGGGSDWLYMERDYADGGTIIRNVVETSGGWSTSSYASVSNMCGHQDCSISSSGQSAYPYPWIVWDGSAVLMADYYTAAGELWAKYDRWMLLYTVEHQDWSYSRNSCWDLHSCCNTCPEEPPGDPPGPNVVDIFLVIDNGLPGGEPGVNVKIETVTSWEDHWARTMKIYDCLGEPLYLVGYRIEDCDNEQNWFRYAMYYKGELTISEKFTADEECVTDYQCDQGDFCQGHSVEGAYQGQHGYAKGFVGACFWDLYTWERFTKDPGGAFPVEPKVRNLPTE
jgi:hypothetical protein